VHPIFPCRNYRHPRSLLNTWAGITQRETTMAITSGKSIGMILLAVWLILTGLIPILNLSFSGLGLVMQILAIAAGVCILLRV
jgi:hypothetical protein